MENTTTKLKSKEAWHRCNWARAIVASVAFLAILGVVYLGLSQGCNDWATIKTKAEPIFASLGGFGGVSVIVTSLVKCWQNKSIKEACDILDQTVEKIKKETKKKK